MPAGPGQAGLLRFRFWFAIGFAAIFGAAAATGWARCGFLGEEQQPLVQVNTCFLVIAGIAVSITAILEANRNPDPKSGWLFVVGIATHFWADMFKFSGSGEDECYYPGRCLDPEMAPTPGDEIPGSPTTGYIVAALLNTVACGIFAKVATSRGHFKDSALSWGFAALEVSLAATRFASGSGASSVIILSGLALYAAGLLHSYTAVLHLQGNMGAALFAAALGLKWFAHGTREFSVYDERFGRNIHAEAANDDDETALKAGRACVGLAATAAWMCMAGSYAKFKSQQTSNRQIQPDAGNDVPGEGGSPATAYFVLGMSCDMFAAVCIRWSQYTTKFGDDPTAGRPFESEQEPHVGRILAAISSTLAFLSLCLSAKEAWADQASIFHGESQSGQDQPAGLRRHDAAPGAAPGAAPNHRPVDF